MLLAVAMVPAQGPKQPLLPPKYHVILRYNIPAPRDQHVAQYDAMIAHLEKLKFEFVPPLAKRPETDREDRTKNRMEGFITPDKVRFLLDNPSIASVLIFPDDIKLEDLPPADPVHIRIELASGLDLDRQRELFEQSRALLTLQKFQEAVGYDHRGYTRKPFSRLVGTIPAAGLETLLKDLRGQPGGWLAPVIPPEDIPAPLAKVDPVRIVEVLREKAPIKPLADAEPRTPDYLDKISADLWELVKQPEPPPGRITIQVAVAGTLREDDNTWRALLTEIAPGVSIEGQLGQFVTGRVPIGEIKALAALPRVSVIRLPRLTRVDADPALKFPGDNAKVLAQSGVARLHALGAKGKGVKLGIIDVDFRGWEKLVKAGKLPPGTRIVDLTSERDRDLVPAAYPGDPDQLGHGTLCAQAAALAAPQAEFILIRTDAIDPYQLREIAGYVEGGRYSPNIEARRDDIVLLRGALNARRDELVKERERVLNNFDDETELRTRRGFLGAAYTWLYSEREWHLARMKQYEAQDEDLKARDRRLQAFLRTVDSLRGIQVLANPIVWGDSFPLGGLSPLSRWFNQDARGPLWFQSVGNKREQCWVGDFRSLAGQPAMDFAATPAKGRWATDLNFLAWQPHTADRQLDLAEKTQIRITVQWREPHDPAYFMRADEPDYYRKPLATLKLVLLKQRDADAHGVPADLLEAVAQSTGLPQRLEYTPGGAVYEIALDFTVDKAGRYALRVEKQPDYQWIVGLNPTRKSPQLAKVEGLNPIGVRPLGVPVLPAGAQNWELRPRVFVETIDEVMRLKGRVVFNDYWTEAGTVGSPADARGVISVGAAGLDGKPRPYTAVGSMPYVELSRRPHVLAYDALQLDAGTAFGSSVANAFAAGAATSLLSAGVPRDSLVGWLHGQDGKLLAIPDVAGK